MTYDVPMGPYSFEDEDLVKLASNGFRTVLIVGEKEPILDVQKATQRAKDAGVDVVVVPDAGHLWCRTMEKEFATVVSEVLLSGNGSGVNDRRRSKM